MSIEDILKAYFPKYKEVLCVYLFGSIAVGKQRPSSDVDLAILFDFRVPESDYAQRQLTFMDEISRLLDRNVDVVVLNRTSSFLKFHVIQVGKRIYERSDRAEHHFEAYTIAEYLDFLPIQKRLEAALVHHLKGT